MFTRLLILLTVFFSPNAWPVSHYDDYYKIEKHYRSQKENYSQALPWVDKNIRTAKNNKNTEALLWSYEDAIFFNPHRAEKLIYADSTLALAKSTTKPELIARAFLGRGIIYYFNFKNYRKALADYIEAYQFVALAKDDYLKYKIEYHLAVIRAYLGYHDEAMKHFTSCLQYFRKNLCADSTSYYCFNQTRAYVNTLHQVSMIRRVQGRVAEAQEACLQSLRLIAGNPAYTQEQAYIAKEKGIMQYMGGQYRQAVSTLEKDLSVLQRLQDASNFTLACYYIGKASIRLGDQRKADSYFVKIDSVFNRTGYLHPEVRLVYKYLVEAGAVRQMPNTPNCYTAQWTKLDSATVRDFPEISAKIFTDYDMAKLMAEKQQLTKEAPHGRMVLLSACVLAACLMLVILWRLPLRAYIAKKTLAALKKFRYRPGHVEHRGTVENVTILSWEKDLLNKLALFEKNKGFLNPELNVHSLANDFNTNRTYLSKAVKKAENVPFNTYISNLRIRYITEKLMQNNKYLNYSVDALAAECGMTSRRVFYKHFLDINGMMPSEFINKIKKEQDKT